MWRNSNKIRYDTCHYGFIDIILKWNILIIEHFNFIFDFVLATGSYIIVFVCIDIWILDRYMDFWNKNYSKFIWCIKNQTWMLYALIVIIKSLAQKRFNSCYHSFIELTNLIGAFTVTVQSRLRYLFIEF